MSVKKAPVGDIEIAYEEISQEGEPLILIMGLGSQMVLWRDELCEQFAEEGFRVIRFDNRDVGLSTRFNDQPVPRIGRVVLRRLLRLQARTPYSLNDMAADVVGLLDHLQIERAHIVGTSMGGMVAQTVALRHTDRVSSLTSIMSSTGDLSHFLGKPKVLARLTRKPPTEREAAIEHVVETFRMIHGNGHLDFDEDNMREVATTSYERGFDPRGIARQLGAIASSGSRKQELAELDLPTQVIHGSHDPLLRTRAGRATANAIPGARLDIIEGMGHGMPREVWPRIVERVRAIADEAKRRQTEATVATNDLPSGVQLA